MSMLSPVWGKQFCLIWLTFILTIEENAKPHHTMEDVCQCIGNPLKCNNLSCTSCRSCNIARRKTTSTQPSLHTGSVGTRAPSWAARLTTAAKFKQQPASETSTIKVAVLETHLFLARSFQIGKDLCEDVNREEDAWQGVKVFIVWKRREEVCRYEETPARVAQGEHHGRDPDDLPAEPGVILKLEEEKVPLRCLCNKLGTVPWDFQQVGWTGCEVTRDVQYSEKQECHLGKYTFCWERKSRERRRLTCFDSTSSKDQERKWKSRRVSSQTKPKKESHWVCPKKPWQGPTERFSCSADQVDVWEEEQLEPKHHQLPGSSQKRHKPWQWASE